MNAPTRRGRPVEGGKYPANWRLPDESSESLVREARVLVRHGVTTPDRAAGVVGIPAAELVPRPSPRRTKYTPRDEPPADGGDFYGPADLPPVATLTRPGSEKRILILEARASYGLALHHPDDASIKRSRGVDPGEE